MTFLEIEKKKILALQLVYVFRINIMSCILVLILIFILNHIQCFLVYVSMVGSLSLSLSLSLTHTHLLIFLEKTQGSLVLCEELRMWE